MKHMPETVLIDWGTSNLRMWYVDAAQHVIGEHRSALGISKLKPGEYEPLLEKILAEYGFSNNVPVLICGMAGAAQGWQDAGYMEVPACPTQGFWNAIKVETTSGRDIRILPGLAQRNAEKPDVMRGEETLLSGAVELGFEYPVYCLPGTHSKWVSMTDGFIDQFTTFMTGELFALLSEHSTLSHTLEIERSNGFNLDVFREAFTSTMQNPLILHECLFSLRAGPLLNFKCDSDGLRAELSGLLIGAEIAAMKPKVSGAIGLAANGTHSEVYQLAFESAEMECELINSDDLALAGLSRVAKNIWSKHEGE